MTPLPAEARIHVRHALSLPRRGLILGGLGLLAACAPGRDLPPIADAPPGPYRLGAGDRLRVITFGEEGLGGSFQVSDAGTIAFPLLGNVPVAGLSTEALASRLAGLMRERNLLRSPSVVVEIEEYRPIFVLGEVAKPGQYPYRPGMTLLTAVAVAGGFTYRAVQGHAGLLRLVDGRAQEGRIERQGVIQPGDTITVYERIF